MSARKKHARGRWPVPTTNSLTTNNMHDWRISSEMEGTRENRNKKKWDRKRNNASHNKMRWHSPACRNDHNGKGLIRRTTSNSKGSTLEQIDSQNTVTEQNHKKLQGKPKRDCADTLHALTWSRILQECLSTRQSALRGLTQQLGNSRMWIRLKSILKHTTTATQLWSFTCELVCCSWVSFEAEHERRCLRACKRFLDLLWALCLLRMGDDTEKMRRTTNSASDWRRARVADKADEMLKNTTKEKSGSFVRKLLAQHSIDTKTGSLLEQTCPRRHCKTFWKKFGCMKYTYW